MLQVITGNDNGGGGNHVLNIFNSSKGYFECTLCFIGTGELCEKAKKNNLNFVFFNNKEVAQAKFIKFINSGFDLINFHGAKANFIHFIIKHKIKPRCIVTVHSDYRLDFKNNSVKQLIFTPMSILGLKSFNTYVCVSEHLRELLDRKNFTGTKTVIENGIAIEENPLIKNKINFRRLYGISESDFVYLLLARMHPVKNHEKLIDAFNLLKSEHDDIKLLFVGDGKLEYYLKEKTQKLGLTDSVIFAGYQTNTADFINICNISMLTSISEGATPTLSLLESGIMKKPVICSNIGDLPDIIKENMGFLINPDSVDDIYSKMKQAYQKGAYLPAMGLNFYNLIKEEYSIRSFIEKYQRFYKSVLGFKCQ